MTLTTLSVTHVAVRLEDNSILHDVVISRRNDVAFRLPCVSAADALALVEKLTSAIEAHTNDVVWQDAIGPVGYLTANEVEG